MSSKQKYVTIGPTSGLYEHKAVPMENEDIPVYLQDELLSLGGIVNGILQGGAFPPESIMPQRWREGMIIYFKQAVEPDGGGVVHIDSAGLWLYREGAWWKIVDDPSVLGFSLFVYGITSTESSPWKPVDGDELPPLANPIDPGEEVVWSLTPPTKSDKAFYIWASAMTSVDGRGKREWDNPVIWSAGVLDGIKGDAGADASMISEDLIGDVTTVKEYPISSLEATTSTYDTVVLQFAVGTASGKDRTLVLDAMELEAYSEGDSGIIATKAQLTATWTSTTYTTRTIAAEGQRRGPRLFPDRNKGYVGFVITIPAGVTGVVTVRHIGTNNESIAGVGGRGLLLGSLATIYFAGEDLTSASIQIQNGPPMIEET
jgi:hypothetical protein